MQRWGWRVYDQQRGGHGCIMVVFDILIVVVFAGGVWCLIHATTPPNSQPPVQRAAPVATTQTTPVQSRAWFRTDMLRFGDSMLRTVDTCKQGLMPALGAFQRVQSNGDNSEVPSAQDYNAIRNPLDHAGTVCFAAAASLRQVGVPSALAPYYVLHLSRWKADTQLALTDFARGSHEFVSAIDSGAILNNDDYGGTTTITAAWRR